jgi:hypothetical protein
MDRTNEVWGQENYNYDVEEGQTGVMVNGALVAVEEGANFRDTIKNVSLDAGFGKYRVYLNGAEIRPSEAPATFARGDKAEIRAYDDAGIIG